MSEFGASDLNRECLRDRLSKAVCSLRLKLGIINFKIVWGESTKYSAFQAI